MIFEVFFAERERDERIGHSGKKAEFPDFEGEKPSLQFSSLNYFFPPPACTRYRQRKDFFSLIFCGFSLVLLLFLADLTAVES